MRYTDRILRLPDGATPMKLYLLAQAVLGEKFDVLEQHINEWIAQEKNPEASAASR